MTPTAAQTRAALLFLVHRFFFSAADFSPLTADYPSHQIARGYPSPDNTLMLLRDLGQLAYRPAWAIQEEAHASVVAGGEEQLLLVEHTPVITFGRRPNVARNMLASDEQLAQLGVEVVQSDRGGDITFHGPGQIVAYPIVRLIDHRLSVGGYVRRLEQTVIDTLAEFGIAAQLDPAAVGVWTPGWALAGKPPVAPEDTSVSKPPVAPEARSAGKPPVAPATSAEPGAALAKICALGVRIRRGISMHGIALNVTTDLRSFNLIVPCGLTGRAVTSMQQILGPRTPPIAAVKQALVRRVRSAFSK